MASFSAKLYSGTTGNPKGVVYSHRGAYLNAIGNNMIWPLNKNTHYLWTLPMFHCNGWCFPWTVVAVGGLKFVYEKSMLTTSSMPSLNIILAIFVGRQLSLYDFECGLRAAC